MKTLRIQILIILLLLLSGLPFTPQVNAIPPIYNSETDSVVHISTDSINKMNNLEWDKNFVEKYSGKDFDYTEKDKKKVEPDGSSSDWFPNFSPLIFGSFITILYFLFKIFLIAVGLYILYRIVHYLQNQTPQNKTKTKEVQVNLNPDTIEDIHEIDFEKEVKEAQKNQNFRLAIRWSYLWTLKKMDDKKMIDWKPKKTNQDYTRELKSKNHKKTFKKLTYIFDYTWFGNFAITDSIYQETMNEFATYRKSIR